MLTYLSLVNSFFFFCLKVYLSNISIDIPALLLSFAYLFSSLNFQPMYAHKSESLVHSIWLRLVVFSIHSLYVFES